jgi:hypothetical protein
LLKGLRPAPFSPSDGHDERGIFAPDVCETAFSAVSREVSEIGFLAGQRLRLRPIVLDPLLGAGY